MNHLFASNDIRRFLTSRVVSYDNEQKLSEEDQCPPFDNNCCVTGKREDNVKDDKS